MTQRSPTAPALLEEDAASIAAVLRGTRVVELSGGLAGEHCGYALAGLGATVLAVRRPDAESQTDAPHPLDASKQIVELDVGTAEGFEDLVRLCAGASLVIEDRPPLGWPQGSPLSPKLLKREQRLIAICMSPFGLTGPHAQYAAYPLNCYHAGGNAQQIPCDPLRPEDRMRAPLQAGGQWGEAQAGTMAAIAALGCLLDRDRHRGTIVDCSKQEALISYNWTEAARYPNEGRSPSRLAPLATIVGGVLPTRDGFVQVVVREDHQWGALARLLEHPEWADDLRYASRAARISRWQDIASVLAGETRKFSTRHLHFTGRELGIPIAAVLSVPELLADGDLAARDVWQEVTANGGHRVKLPRWDRWTSRSSGESTDVAPPCGASPGAPVHAQAGDDGAPEKPLHGVRVLDLGWVAMGPYAGYVLACLGAEVIHIARPQTGDATGVNLSAYNYGFDTLNTGKAWVAIDLKRHGGADLVRGLAARSDIVLENFRPGVVERLGLGFRELSVLNPRLVMVSASTYGRHKIGGAYVGYAPVFSALSGLAHFTGHADGPPAEVSHPVDFFAGSVGILGVLAGLHRRMTTGEGCHIDLSAREAILWSLSHEVALQQIGFRDGQRLGNRHPAMAPHGVYRCRGENRWISIVAGNDAEWQRLAACMGSAALGDDSRFTTVQRRLERRAELDQLIEAWTQVHDVDPLVERLQGCGVAAVLSVTSEDLWRDVHVQARGNFAKRESSGGVRWYVAPPWRYDGRGRHRLQTLEGDAAIRTVFADLLGLPSDRIEALKRDGVIAAR